MMTSHSRMKKSCWGCYYENNSKCYWFKLVQKSTPKQIPKKILKEGCPQYSNNKRQTSLEPRIKKIIDKFDGEIIGSKYVPFKYYPKYKKRKYVKSAHNYSYRKDAQ